MTRRRGQWTEDETERSLRSRLRDRNVVSIVLSVLVVGGVLAALAGTFLFGPAGTEPTGPPADFDVRASPGDDGWATGDERVVITHDGGEILDPGAVALYVTVDGDLDAENRATGVAWPTDEWVAGETATYTGEVPANATLRLVWSAPDGDQRQLLAEWDVEAVDGRPSVGETDAAERREPAAAVLAADSSASGPHRSSSAHSQSATAAASRSWAVAYEILAG